MNKILTRWPGWLVFGITVIWIGPISLLMLMGFGDSPYIYLSIFVVAVLVMLALNRIAKSEAWKRRRSWQRILIVCAAYDLIMILSLVLILLEGDGIRFQGMDGGGSGALFMLPSAVLYSLAGIVLAVISHHRDKRQGGKE
jgi:hypothetical protein